MRAPIMTIACLLAALAATTCAPAFNWRETAIPASSLSAMFPCKPENAARKVVMAGQEVELHMRHCDAAGVTTAIGHADIADAALAGPVLAQWQAATMAGMHVSTSSRSPWTMAGATVLPQAISIEAAGTGADGKPLLLRAAWFARGGEVYAALLYGPALSPDVVDAFFSGLRLE